MASPIIGLCRQREKLGAFLPVARQQKPVQMEDKPRGRHSAQRPHRPSQMVSVGQGSRRVGRRDRAGLMGVRTCVAENPPAASQLDGAVTVVLTKRNGMRVATPEKRRRFAVPLSPCSLLYINSAASPR